MYSYNYVSILEGVNAKARQQIVYKCIPIHLKKEKCFWKWRLCKPACCGSLTFLLWTLQVESGQEPWIKLVRSSPACILAQQKHHFKQLSNNCVARKTVTLLPLPWRLGTAPQIPSNCGVDRHNSGALFVRRERREKVNLRVIKVRKGSLLSPSSCFLEYHLAWVSYWDAGRPSF